MYNQGRLSLRQRDRSHLSEIAKHASQTVKRERVNLPNVIAPDRTSKRLSGEAISADNIDPSSSCGADRGHDPRDGPSATVEPT